MEVHSSQVESLWGFGEPATPCVAHWSHRSLCGIQMCLISGLSGLKSCWAQRRAIGHWCVILNGYAVPDGRDVGGHAFRLHIDLRWNGLCRPQVYSIAAVCGATCWRHMPRCHLPVLSPGRGFILTLCPIRSSGRSLADLS